MNDEKRAAASKKLDLAVDDNDDEAGCSSFTINENFAQRYDKWRSKEETQKLKDRYGEDVLDHSEQSSSSSDVEDENAEYLNADLELGFFKTLSLIRSKDRRIYDPNYNFYTTHSNTECDDKDRGDQTTSQQHSNKPLYLRDYDRKVMLERGGIYEYESDPEGNTEGNNIKSYHQEQADIKDSIRRALESAEATSRRGDGDSDSDCGQLLVRKVKSREEKLGEEAQYIEWLKGNSSGVGDDGLK